MIPYVEIMSSFGVDLVSELVGLLTLFETVNLAGAKLCVVKKTTFIRRVYADDHVMSAKDWLRYYFLRPRVCELSDGVCESDVKQVLDKLRTVFITSDFSEKSVNEYSFATKSVLNKIEKKYL